MSEAKRKRLLEPGFRYTKSEDTDLKALFARVRRQQKAAEEADKKPPANVKSIAPKKGKAA